MLDRWHQTADSKDDVKKFNHISGRYAVWGRFTSGRELWEIRDGQGPQGQTVAGPFATKNEAMQATEDIILANEGAVSTTHVRR
jgi:hypothetical protein